jgi:hypothetical protein
MVLSLTTNTGNSYQASQANSLDELTVPRATTDSSPTSANLSSDLEDLSFGALSFGAETKAIAKAHRSLTEEFQELSFSARNFVRATAA